MNQSEPPEFQKCLDLLKRLNMKSIFERDIIPSQSEFTEGEGSSGHKRVQKSMQFYENFSLLKENVDRCNISFESRQDLWDYNILDYIEIKLKHLDYFTSEEFLDYLEKTKLFDFYQQEYKALDESLNEIQPPFKNNSELLEVLNIKNKMNELDKKAIELSEYIKKFTEESEEELLDNLSKSDGIFESEQSDDKKNIEKMKKIYGPLLDKINLWGKIKNQNQIHKMTDRDITIARTYDSEISNWKFLLNNFLKYLKYCKKEKEKAAFDELNEQAKQAQDNLLAELNNEEKEKEKTKKKKKKKKKKMPTDADAAADDVADNAAAVAAAAADNAAKAAREADAAAAVAAKAAREAAALDAATNAKKKTKKKKKKKKKPLAPKIIERIEERIEEIDDYLKKTDPNFSRVARELSREILNGQNAMIKYITRSLINKVKNELKMELIITGGYATSLLSKGNYTTEDIDMKIYFLENEDYYEKRQEVYNFLQQTLNNRDYIKSIEFRLVDPLEEQQQKLWSRNASMAEELRVNINSEKFLKEAKKTPIKIYLKNKNIPFPISEITFTDDYFDVNGFEKIDNLPVIKAIPLAKLLLSATDNLKKRMNDGEKNLFSKKIDNWKQQLEVLLPVIEIEDINMTEEQLSGQGAAEEPGLQSGGKKLKKQKTRKQKTRKQKNKKIII